MGLLLRPDLFWIIIKRVGKLLQVHGKVSFMGTSHYGPY